MGKLRLVSEGTQSIFLTVVIPAYNEETRLPPTLVRVADFLRTQPYRTEVLVVENGSTDRTSVVVEEFAAAQVCADDPFEIILLHSLKGKGNAVRQGVAAARGDYILISDTDLSVPIEATPHFLPPELDKRDYGIAIASREVPGANRHGEPQYRHLMGRVFNFLVRWLAVAEINDTQCGFKCFSREAARRVFPLQRINGWGFDVELLYIAQRHGIPIVEIPVDWYYRDESRVRPVHDTVTMVAELLRIRRNGRAGVYDAPQVSPQGDEVTAL